MYNQMRREGRRQACSVCRQGMGSLAAFAAHDIFPRRLRGPSRLCKPALLLFDDGTNIVTPGDADN